MQAIQDKVKDLLVLKHTELPEMKTMVNRSYDFTMKSIDNTIS